MNKNIGAAVVEVFSEDASEGGYIYTRPGRLSSRLSNERMSEVISAALPLAGMRVIDLGCGDGTYTIEFVRRDRAAYVLGVDPAAEAISYAENLLINAKTHNCEFLQSGIGELKYQDAFDVAIIRGVLHHLDDPAGAVAMALKVARKVIVLEPNGLNPVLKIIERTSNYHIRHGERSFWPWRVDGWARAAGGQVIDRKFVILVPFFCPDWMARILKKIEPFIEAMPFVRNFVCGQYLMVAERVR